MTSRLETFRYRDFSQFFESIGRGLENFGLKKKSRYRSRHIWSQKESRYRSRKHLVLKKSLGIGLENIWSGKKVSVSKILVSKQSLGIGLDEIFCHSVSSLSVTMNKNPKFKRKASIAPGGECLQK